MTRNNVALYVGTPREMRDRLENEWRKDGLMTTPTSPKWTKPLQLLNASPTLYIPDAQRGIAAIGAAGSGKTISIIYNLMIHFGKADFAGIIYDFKNGELTELAKPIFKERLKVIALHNPNSSSESSVMADLAPPSMFVEGLRGAREWDTAKRAQDL